MPVDHTKTIIELSDVSFAYDATPVLSNINLSIHSGDYLGIVGPNGSGKTTLLRVVLGLLRPSGGSVKLFGSDSKKFRDWQKIGYVPQKAINFDALFPASVYEVVAMGRFGRVGIGHWLKQADSVQIEKALAEVGMSDYRDRLIGDLSSGQQQRVFIARALAGEPEILVLDEPTVGVDVQTQEQFYALLRHLNQDLGLTLVMISHDIDVIANEATELACINQTLVYHGAPREFVAGDYLNKLYGKDLHQILHNH